MLERVSKSAARQGEDREVPRCARYLGTRDSWPVHPREELRAQVRGACASRTSPGFPAPRAGYNHSVEIGGETMGTITTKRIYDEPGDADGERILVDRLWPRGISKDRARLTAWDKDVAPSTELRKWFGHDPDRFAEFSARYRDELSSSSAAEELASRCRDQLVQGRNVTLLYAAKDASCNHAVVLGDWLAEKTKTA